MSFLCTFFAFKDAEDVNFLPCILAEMPDTYGELVFPTGGLKVHCHWPCVKETSCFCHNGLSESLFLQKKATQKRKKRRWNTISNKKHRTLAVKVKHLESATEGRRVRDVRRRACASSMRRISSLRSKCVPRSGTAWKQTERGEGEQIQSRKFLESRSLVWHG